MRAGLFFFVYRELVECRSNLRRRCAKFLFLQNGKLLTIRDPPFALELIRCSAIGILVQERFPRPSPFKFLFLQNGKDKESFSEKLL